jgi:NAD(P)-dependent dehydrogenase (short-subunit alcohol dehydrogenase family)
MLIAERQIVDTYLVKIRTQRVKAVKASYTALRDADFNPAASPSAAIMKRRRTKVMGRLDGRIAIVTGGAKGIGRHYSRALAAEGARLMIADVIDGKEIEDEIAGNHGVHSVASAITDVSDEIAVISLVAQTIERFGKIDILVNNAAMFAVLHETKCTEIDVALWDRVMAVNLRGPFLMVKHVVPRMKARQYGKIINIGSGTAYRGVPMLLHYVTSKGGIVAFTRALSRELGEHGIRVNTLAPGFTLSDSIIQENPEHVRTAQPRAIAARAIPRDEHPQDLLGALIFLASGDSDFVTGQNIAVDGGNVNT